MKNIIKASIFKLFKEKTFYVTLIVGLVLSVVLVLLYNGIDKNAGGGAHFMCNGSQFLIASSAPLSNFAIAVPVNLSILVIGEFTFGTIRNKVIVGYRKSYVYFSLFVVGLIFTLTLMTLYTALSVMLSSFIGGFDPSGLFTLEKALKWIAITINGYIFITSLCVFSSTLTRNQGLSLGIIIFVLVILVITSNVFAATKIGIENIEDKTVLIAALHPLFFQTLATIGANVIKESSGFLAFSEVKYFVPALISPLVYALLFYIVGSAIFSKRDLK